MSSQGAVRISGERKLASAFASKSEAKRVITQLGGNWDGHKAVIEMWPIASSPTATGVAVRVDGKGLQSRVCNDKTAILAFLAEVL